MICIIFIVAFCFNSGEEGTGQSAWVPQVFLDIEKNTKPDALICTNTSGLNIEAFLH